MTTIRLNICITLLRDTKVEVTDDFFTNFQCCNEVELYVKSKNPILGGYLPNKLIIYNISNFGILFFY